MRRKDVSRGTVRGSTTPSFVFIPHSHVRFRASMPTFYDRFRECAERWPDHIALEIQRRDRLESYRYR